LILILVACLLIAPATTFAQIIELKHDDGDREQLFDRFWGHEKMGLKILFSPPTSPWLINEIKIYGRGYGDFLNKEYSVEIWDGNSNVLYSRIFTGGFSDTEDWVTLDISYKKISVTGDFYVVVFPDSDRVSGFSIGMDTSSASSSSDIIFKNSGKPVPDWYSIRPIPWMGDNRDHANWMVRVIGGVNTPQTTPPVIAPVPTQAPTSAPVLTQPPVQASTESILDSEPAGDGSPERTFFGVDFNIPVLTDPAALTILTLVLGVLTLLIQLFRGV
jgi:hypothetical protein